jgi:hypothetical protein
MYELKSGLSKRAYLSALKQTFRSPFRIWDERVCGIVIGPFFSVAYHSPYEWNRRITSECNRAWGYVKETDGETHVTFIRGKGLLAPSWFVIYTFVCFVILLCAGFELYADHEPAFLAISCAMALAICLITAFQSIVTEAGEAGFHEITRLLLHPEEYYG